MGLLRRFRIDPYLVLILLMVVLATLLPVRAAAADIFGWATKLAIAVLFFFHGAKLSRDAVIAGLGAAAVPDCPAPRIRLISVSAKKATLRAPARVKNTPSLVRNLAGSPSTCTRRTR